MSNTVNIDSPNISGEENKIKITPKTKFFILSPTDLIAKLNICCETCFIALLPGEPARATSFRVGYMASNLSVACIKTDHW